MNKSIRSGVWKAQGGSTFKIIVKGNKVIGHYSTTHGRPNPSDKFEARGLINEKTIGITVSFGDFYSLSTWCGYWEEENNLRKECITASWIHTRMFKDDEHTVPIEGWRHFNIGEGSFFWEGNLTQNDINEITSKCGPL